MFLAAAAVIMIAAVMIAGLLFLYRTEWRLTDRGTEVSPDGRYRILVQEKGEPDFPFGNSHAKVTVYGGDGEVIQTFLEDIADDGARFDADNYSVEWTSDTAVITLKGSEQEDKVVVIPL